MSISVEKKQILKEKGINCIDSSTAILAEDQINGYKLTLTHVGNYSMGKRLYRLLEMEGGKYIGELNEEHSIKVNDVEELQNGKVRRLISEMYGDYQDQINQILDRMTAIETHRLLTINECEGGLPMEQALEELKKWLLDNPTDRRVVYVKINNRDEVGLTGNMKEVEGVLKMFDSDLNFKLFKSECKRTGRIKTDQEKYRYTRKIEAGVREKFGIESSHFFNLNFDNDQNFITEFKEKMKARLEEENNKDRMSE